MNLIFIPNCIVLLGEVTSMKTTTFHMSLLGECQRQFCAECGRLI